jgi:hypothetical protein
MKGAYVHVALSVVVEAEQHQALPSAFAETPETLQAHRLDLEFSLIFSTFSLGLESRPCLASTQQENYSLGQFCTPFEQIFESGVPGVVSVRTPFLLQVDLAPKTCGIASRSLFLCIGAKRR